MVLFEYNDYSVSIESLLFDEDSYVSLLLDEFIMRKNL